MPKARISTARDTFYFISPDKTPAQFIGLFRRDYGPTMNAFEAAERDGKAKELHRQLVELAESQNQCKNGGRSIPATFFASDCFGLIGSPPAALPKSERGAIQ